MSMKGHSPPIRCASAAMCWHMVVLPEASGPEISITRPRGTPPTLREMSRESEPAGMTLTFRWLASPLLMIAPPPNRLMIGEIVCSRAWGEAGID